MKIFETINAYGHRNIRSTHRTTFEITRESHLTRTGDCIIAVGADKAAVDLKSPFKKAVRANAALLTVIINVGELREIIQACGHTNLRLTHSKDIVIRKSSYVCPRTLGVRANKAAKDFHPGFVDKLRNPDQKLKITLCAEVT